MGSSPGQNYSRSEMGGARRPGEMGGLRRWGFEHPGLAFLLLSALVVAVAYGHALAGPFIYDDMDQVVKNANLASWGTFAGTFLLKPVVFTNSLLSHGASTYRPIFWLSLFLDRQIWGLRAGGYHLTNLLLHWIDGNLAFLLLRRLRLPSVQAASACLLWLLLPINAEVVAWVSGRSYALCLLFVLLTLLLGVRSLQREESGAGAALGVAVGCFVGSSLALLAHESGILTVPLFLLAAYGAGRLRLRAAWPALAGMVAAGLGWRLVEHAVGVQWAPASGSVWTAGLFFWRYVALIALPVHMSVERSTSTPNGGVSLLAAVAWAAVAVLCVGLLLLRKRLPGVSTGLGWMTLCLLPFCGVLLIYQGMAERFAYIASAGFALAVIALCAGMERAQWQTAALSVVVAWTAWSLWRVEVRVGDWGDPVRLYRSSLEANPQSPLLEYNLGHALFDKNDLTGALAKYQRALALQPGYPHADASVGDVYLQQGQIAAAQAAYQRALASDATDVSVILNSGVAYERTGQWADAEQTFLRAIAMAPKDDSPRVDLGTLYMQEKRWNDAATQFARAIDANEKDPTPYYDLAVLLQRAGKNDLALRLYQKVLELKPNDADTIENMQRLAATPQP